MSADLSGKGVIEVLQLGTSADMFMMALVSFVSVGWPSLVTGMIIGFRNSMVVEFLIISAIGAVVSVAWVHLSGFGRMFDDASMVTIMACGYFAGLALGFLASTVIRAIRSRTT